MKKAIFYTVAFFLSTSLFAQNLSVEQIMAKVKENENIKSSTSTSKQVITTSKGNRRTLEMTSYSKDFGKSQLSVYTSPARVEGDKMLMLNDGDEIWFYTPKTDRVRHIASSAKKQKVQGSDFSYQDMEMWDYKTDFKLKLLGSEKIGEYNCYKIEMIPTETGPQYSKMIGWIDKEMFAARQFEYYEDGQAIKMLQLTDYKKMDIHWVPVKYTMKSLIDGGYTEMENMDMQINVELSDDMFTTNYLKRK